MNAFTNASFMADVYRWPTACKVGQRITIPQYQFKAAVYMYTPHVPHPAGVVSHVT